MFLGITPVSSVSNGLYFLTLPLVSVMRVIYWKIRHARYLYIKRNVEKVWGARYTLVARYLSKNTVLTIINSCVKYFVIRQQCQPHCWVYMATPNTLILWTAISKPITIKGKVLLLFNDNRVYAEELESSWNVMAHGDAREGKWRGNWRMQWVASTLHTTSEHGVSSITTADAHTSAASSRPNWSPPPI